MFKNFARQLDCHDINILSKMCVLFYIKLTVKFQVSNFRIVKSFNFDYDFIFTNYKN